MLIYCVTWGQAIGLGIILVLLVGAFEGSKWWNR